MVTSNANIPLPLPALHPLIRLYEGPSNAHGTPTWTLHHPVSNTYFKIGWAEFECLARFHRYKDAPTLINAVNTETTLHIDEDDVKALILFLHANGLVSGADAIARPPKKEKKQSLGLKILHHYLFFTLPLFRPQQFLTRTLGYVSPLLTRAFICFSLGLLVIMSILTFQRADEFFHTFFQFLSFEGAATIAVLFMAIKIIHECAHAYTATKYGVPVPHMGIAFIVLYPVLYTETTGAWRLHSRKQRIYIGFAGILAELSIAAYALVLWHILAPGLWQSLAFGVVAISLTSSLLINLNPLMRFDGYYVLSDSLGVENLHARAIAYARWYVRKNLFGLQDPPPETRPLNEQKILIGFGFAVVIYRFFLFLGIALLVYHIFFPPLGALLMIVELAWFIGLPIYKELKIWYERRSDIWRSSRTKVLFFACCVFFIMLALPLWGHITVPAIHHAALYRTVYPPAPSVITEINVQSGQKVREGDILIRLESLPLKRDLASASMRLEMLQHMRRREQTNPALYRKRRTAIEQEIEAARDAVESLQKRQENLIIKAEFSGIILDMPSGLHTGRTLKTEDLLFRLIEPEKAIVTGYLNEDQLARVGIGSEGIFTPSYSLFSDQIIKLEEIAPVNSTVLKWPELASVNAGPIPAEYFSSNNTQSGLFPRQAIYAVKFSTTVKINENQELITPGAVRLKTEKTSIMRDFIKRSGAFLIRESGLNKS